MFRLLLVKKCERGRALLPIVILFEERVLQLVVDLAAQFGHGIWMIGRHRRQFTLHRVSYHVIDHFYVEGIK